MNNELDMNRIPTHIAIIMDGNGRWAMERGKERTYGHQAGVESVRRITTECSDLGVKFLTLYTFSTENWNRPNDEVAALMGLVLTSLEEQCEIPRHRRLETPARSGSAETEGVGRTYGKKQRHDHGGCSKLQQPMGDY